MKFNKKYDDTSLRVTIGRCSRFIFEPITFFSRRNIQLRLGVGFCYAEKGGKLVLKGQTHWTKINGIWINTKWWQVWIRFRRLGRVHR